MGIHGSNLITSRYQSRFYFNRQYLWRRRNGPSEVLFKNILTINFWPHPHKNIGYRKVKIHSWRKWHTRPHTTKNMTQMKTCVLFQSGEWFVTNILQGIFIKSISIHETVLEGLLVLSLGIWYMVSMERQVGPLEVFTILTLNYSFNTSKS